MERGSSQHDVLCGACGGRPFALCVLFCTSTAMQAIDVSTLLQPYKHHVATGGGLNPSSPKMPACALPAPQQTSGPVAPVATQQGRSSRRLSHARLPRCPPLSSSLPRDAHRQASGGCRVLGRRRCRSPPSRPQPTTTSQHRPHTSHHRTAAEEYRSARAPQCRQKPAPQGASNVFTPKTS